MKHDARAAGVKRRLIIALPVLCLSVILAFIGLHTGVEIESVAFTTSDNVHIRAWLVSPEGSSSERLPAAVFCHGLLASKDIYQHGIRRLARSGMRVLGVDLRGHGRSKGFSDFGKSESIDALAGVDYLLSRPDVDGSRIALVGHSLGGITATRAGCEDAGKKVRAVAAIYCWPSFQDAVEGMFGPLEQGFIGILWHSFAWNHTFPLEEDEIRARDVTPLLGPERRPPNYLLIHATREVLTTRAKAKDLLARAAGVNELEPGITLGEHKGLTARRFALVKGNHGTEAVSPAAFREIETWLSECMDSPISYAGFDAGLAIAFFGTIIAIAAVLYIYSLIRVFFSLRIKRKERDEDYVIRPYWQAVLASAGLIVLSAPAFRLAGSVDMPLMVRTWFGDVLSVYAFVRIMLGLPFLLILAIIYRKKFAEFLRALIPGTPSINDWALGLAPTLWLVASLALIGLFIWIPPALPKDPRGFFILFMILFVFYLIEECAFRGIIMRSAVRPSTRRTAAVTGLVGGLSMSAAFILCFPSLTYSIQLPAISIPMLPVILIIFPLAYYAHSTLTAYLFRGTGNILVPAASMALLLAWLFTTFGARAA